MSQVLEGAVSQLVTANSQLYGYQATTIQAVCNGLDALSAEVEAQAKARRALETKLAAAEKRIATLEGMLQPYREGSRH